MQIYVGNLAYTTTDEELRQLFEPYGIVDRVNLPQDRETGRPRGFGFVEMPNATEAQAAIAGLQGATLGGRTLSINEARPREERGGPRRPRW
jgi:RNA recognition motif-containing protein